MGRDVGGKLAGVQDPGYAQRSGEGPAPLRLGEAGRVYVQVRSPPRKAVSRIDDQGADPGIHRRDDA